MISFDKYDPFTHMPSHRRDDLDNFRHLVFVFVPTLRQDIRLPQGIECLGPCRLDPTLSYSDMYSMRGESGLAYRINLHITWPQSLDEFRRMLDARHLFMDNADSIIFQTNIWYRGSVEDYQDNPTVWPAHMHISKTGYAIRRLNYDTYDKKLLSLSRKH